MITETDTPNVIHPMTISANARPFTLPDSPDSIRALTPCHANATTWAMLTTAVANANPVQKYKNINIVHHSSDWLKPNISLHT
jgi:hypothetical protein